MYLLGPSQSWSSKPCSMRQVRSTCTFEESIKSSALTVSPVLTFGWRNGEKIWRTSYLPTGARCAAAFRYKTGLPLDTLLTEQGRQKGRSSLVNYTSCILLNRQGSQNLLIHFWLCKVGSIAGVHFSHTCWSPSGFAKAGRTAGAPCSLTSWSPSDFARQAEQQELLVHLPPVLLVTWQGSQKPEALIHLPPGILWTSQGRQNTRSSLFTYLLVTYGLGKAGRTAGVPCSPTSWSPSDLTR